MLRRSRSSERVNRRESTARAGSCGRRRHTPGTSSLYDLASTGTHRGERRRGPPVRAGSRADLLRRVFRSTTALPGLRRRMRILPRSTTKPPGHTPVPRALRACTPSGPPAPMTISGRLPKPGLRARHRREGGSGRTVIERGTDYDGDASGRARLRAGNVRPGTARGPPQPPVRLIPAAHRAGAWRRAECWILMSVVITPLPGQPMPACTDYPLRSAPLRRSAKGKRGSACRTR